MNWLNFLCTGILVDEVWLFKLVIPSLWIYQDTYMQCDSDQDRHKWCLKWKFMMIVRPNQWENQTPKRCERKLVQVFVEQNLIWELLMIFDGRTSIKMTLFNSKIPIFKRYVCTSQKSKTSIYQAPNFSFRNAILFNAVYVTSLIKVFVQNFCYSPSQSDWKALIFAWNCVSINFFPEIMENKMNITFIFKKINTFKSCKYHPQVEQNNNDP